MKQLETLLNEVELLNQKHILQNKSTASEFNLFSLLRKAGDEVNLHSRFIHELLDVNGTHGQGSIFLGLFLEVLEINIPIENLSAFREKHNIDILLKSSEHAIIIENKIYTEDHSSQLSRYHETMTNQGYSTENISIVYLTLFGHKPQESLGFEVINIAYRKEIIIWLERCLDEVKEIVPLFVALSQYLNLVEQLTHKSLEKGFILESKNLFLKENNLQTIINAEASVIEAKIEVQLNFWHTLLAKLMPHYAFTFYNSNNDEGLESSVRRYYQQQKNIKDYGIEYEVDKNLYFFVELRDNIYYGFYFMDEDSMEEHQKEAIDALGKQWQDISNTIYWKYPDRELNFKSFNHQNIFDLINKDLREEYIGDISNEIVTFIQNYKRSRVC